MSIYLEPVSMDATAGAIGDHAREVEDLVDDLEATCSADVPVALAAWLAEELREITVHARLAQLLWLLAALDTAVRAQQIQADQSLATVLGYTEAPLASAAAFPTTSIVGGVSPFGTPIDTGTDRSVAIVGGTSREQFLANNPLLAAAENLQGRNPGAAAQLMGLQSFISNSNANMIGAWTNSRPGASYIGDGMYQGRNGNVGSINDVYRDPRRPGEYLVG